MKLMNKFDKLLFPGDDRIINCNRADFMKALALVNKRGSENLQHYLLTGNN